MFLRLRPRLTPIRRYASTLTPRPPMPPDMPREDYRAPTLYTLSYLSRIIKLLLYSALGISAAGLAAFEGLHFYIEHNLMATPAGAEGWASENTSWTGREKGGTDPKLGWKARHALRGAWICQEWGVGGPGGSIGKGQVNRVDRGYEFAEEYIDLAIREAEKRGLFKGDIKTDLMLLKAGVLERLNTEQSLIQASRIYKGLDLDGPRGVRLAGKIGDLEQRTGGNGMKYWTAGLQKAESEATLRAVIGILISQEAHLATTGQYAESARVQQQALSLLTSSTDLQEVWSKHRRALLMLHAASVQHARKLPALETATAAASLAESVHPPTYPISDPRYPSAKLLTRESASLAAEANYTRGILLEKTDLNLAAECFEKAMSYAGERGKEFDRYYRAFARVREKQ